MNIDAPSAKLEQEIAAAAEALLRVASEGGDEGWIHAFELKDRARNGWSAGAMNIAFRGLVRDGALEAGDGDLIRIRTYR